MPKGKPASQLGHQGAVRISFPATAITDLGAFQQSLANVVEKLGCPKCASGLDCSFELERNLIVNERLEIRSAGPAPFLPQDPVPTRPVTITLDGSITHDLGKLQEVTANIFKHLGCGECHSGFDIRFRQALDFHVDDKLNIRSGFGF